MSKTKVAPRGIRNNNPGNIRWGDDWRGLLVRPVRTDKDFCQFVDLKWGIRALVIVLFNYRNKAGQPGVGGKGIDTIREIIYRWAPPSENDTEAYVASVAKSVGIKDDEPINLFDIVRCRALVKAIILHENGQQPYADSQLDVGIKLAYESRL